MSVLSSLQYLALYVGGADGGRIQNASTALTDGEVHMIEMRASGSFSVLNAIDSGGSTVDMLADNNYTGKSFDAGALIFAPYGGYIEDFTSDAEVRYFKLPNTSTKRSKP